MDTNKYFLPIAVVLAGLLIAGAVMWNGSHPGTPQKPGSMTVEDWLTKVTGSVTGIDVNKVKDTVAASKDAYDAAIAADKAEGQTAGIQATPSTLIGTELIAGAYPYDRVASALNAVLQGTKDKGDPAAEVAKLNSAKVTTEGEPFIGDANAPLTVAFWSDFQCPFCKRFEEETLPSVIRDYVVTGKIKFVFKDFAFLGPASTVEAEWARAVWQLYPEKYFIWRTAMFADQQPENSLTI